MQTFEEIYKKMKGDLKILPILHTTDAYSFSQTLKDKKLIPQICPVFSKEFLYTFYGSPSYRISTDKASHNPSLFPICYILDAKFLPEVSRIYPFDSGAFSKKPNIKESYFHPKMKIDDFEISNKENAIKLIEKFYSENRNYLLNQPTLDTKNIVQTNFHAYCYSMMINDKTASETDNRVSTIEFIYDEIIPLNENSVLQIVLPRAFMDDNEIRETIENNFQINDPILYDTYNGYPSSYYSFIYNKYNEFVIEKNLV